jgi:hypothetical protein
MSLPPTGSRSPASPAHGRFGEPAPFARQWLALHRAAGAVAGLGGLGEMPLSPAVDSFPEAVVAIGGWRRSLAQQGVADLAAVMEPGLTALIAAHARGADPQAPARALLAEFTTARDALLALVQAED